MDQTEDFDDAFNEATSTKAPDAGTNAPAEVVVNPPAPAPSPAPAPAPAPSPAPAPAPADDADPVKLQQKLSTVQGILARQGEELSKSQATIKELQAKSAPPAPAPAPAPAVPDESDDLINELESTSPTVTKAVRALMAKERKAMETKFEQEWKQRTEEITGQIKPLKENAETQAVQSHLQTIETAHPKWQSVVASSEFTAWTQTQPAYVQREMRRISEQGTAQEVIDVLDSYRGATTPTQQATQAGGDRRAEQIAALGTIPTKPAATQMKGTDPNDFDGAFNEAVAT